MRGKLRFYDIMLLSNVFKLYEICLTNNRDNNNEYNEITRGRRVLNKDTA